MPAAYVHQLTQAGLVPEFQPFPGKAAIAANEAENVSGPISVSALVGPRILI
jgi:hypothetical protein